MISKATTVTEYLAQLPDDRRTAIEAVRKVMKKNLPKGFEESMQYGMISYYVPHKIYPAGYHCDPKQPLPFAGLASQKNYMSVYLMCYMDEQMDKSFRQAWAKSGKKLDMGKCCIRFKKVDDLALDVVAEAIGRLSTDEYIAIYERSITQAPARAKRARSSKPRRAARA